MTLLRSFVLAVILVGISECVQNCPDLHTPQNGNVALYNKKSTALFTCFHGYMLEGERILQCSGGLWNHPVPACKKTGITCSKLRVPELAEVKCGSETLSVGTKCSYICKEGYIVRGRKTRMCQPNRRWSSAEPSCVPITECPVPLPPVHGEVLECSAENRPTTSKICQFRCNKGYRLIGPRHLICRYTGKLTDSSNKEGFPYCTDFNECLTAKHNCSHKCHNTEGGYFCSCHDGYVLVDKFKCKIPDVCQVENGQCQQICRVSVDQKPLCSCYMGYTLDADGKKCIVEKQTTSACQNDNCNHICYPTRNGGHICSCYDGYKLSDDGMTCIEIPRTPANPCSRQNGYCNQVCTPTNNGQRVCSCHDGYKLSGDDRTCVETPRTPVDPCGYQNGYCDQVCTATNNGQRVCSCHDGYKLSGHRTCVEIPRTPVNPCSYHNGYCSQVCNSTNDSQLVCSCHDGYMLARNGRTCFDINECSRSDLNRCQYKCHNRLGSYSCSCQRGYKLVGNYNCQDIDECAFEELNKCHHKCVNTPGGYTCSCLPGFLLMDGFQCKGCRKNSYRTNMEQFCADCPANSYTESEGKSSVSDCLCLPGFSGNLSQGIPCEDINECENNNFGCSDKCVNEPGGAHCSCPIGFELQSDNKTCIDVDECKIKNGGCQGECKNTFGNFECSCFDGYTMSTTDSYSCDDNDECAVNNGDCEQKCVNFAGGYSCSCSDGFRLDNSQKNCIAVRCPRVPTPHYSTMRCYLKGDNKLVVQRSNNSTQEEPGDYPVQTVCSFTCSTGFKATISNGVIMCQNDGRWNGTIPECKAMQCPSLSAPENGQVHPPDCLTGDISVKQRCYFICHKGFHLTGSPVFTCKNNLTWAGNKTTCVPDKILPFVLCPEDVSVNLPFGKNSYSLTIPSPKTNMDEMKIIPEWVSVDKPINFPAGKTNIMFSVRSPTADNATDSCITTVDVIDIEPPVFDKCPENINVKTAGLHEITVDWVEPKATDNVGIAAITKNLMPNSTLISGVHNVAYIAKDFAGNVASCSFRISVTRIECSQLEDPAHGEANCADWLMGKLCNPSCDSGFMRNPEESSYYICDDFGKWSPSDNISPCLEYFPEPVSGCPDSFESHIDEDTEETICMECPSYTEWSLASRRCETLVHPHSKNNTVQNYENNYEYDAN